MKYNTWHEGLCTEDHMHSWELRGSKWLCLNATHDPRRDNPEPVEAHLAEMIADAKNQIVSDIGLRIQRELDAIQPTGIQSLITRGQVGDNKLHLYGTMTNHKMVMGYKPQPEGTA